MLGKAKPYYKLILQSEDKAEVDRAAEEYKRKNPKASVVIDSWRDHIHHVNHKPLWRARTRIVEERSLLAQILYYIDR